MSPLPDHYIRYPCMKPRIGSCYHSGTQRRLLVIGESHYLPPESRCQLDDDSWYSSSEDDLSEKERGWISTEQIINQSKLDGFKTKAHGIYRNVAKELNASGLQLDRWEDAIEYCAFMNLFQRPAQISGGSIEPTQKDLDVSRGVLEWVLDDVVPELVVAVSSKAGFYAAPTLKQKGLPFAVTPHPTCRWWNRRAAGYGGLKGCEIIPKFLSENHWIAG